MASKDDERLINIAKGCQDYSGGYARDPDKLAAFRHGITTVINALKAASLNDPNDKQSNALESIGRSK